MSIWTVSLTLTDGSGYRMVRPSCVTQKGIPLGPFWTRRTLPSLYCKKKHNNDYNIKHDYNLYRHDHINTI